MASESFCAAGPAASADIQNFWGGSGAGIVAVFRLRAAFDGGGRSGGAAKGVSAGAGGGGAAFDGGIFSAGTGGAGLGGQLGKMAYGIFFRCGENHRRALAGHMDDTGRDDRECGAAEQHRSDDDAHAVCHGGGRLPFAIADATAPAIWDAVAGDHGVDGNLCAARLAKPGAIDFGLYLGALGYDNIDGALGMEAAANSTGD